MHLEDYIADALEIVSARDIPDDDFIDTVNDRARLMARVHPDDFCEDIR
jgi:hypothetical protein